MRVFGFAWLLAGTVLAVACGKSGSAPPTPAPTPASGSPAAPRAGDPASAAAGGTNPRIIRTGVLVGESFHPDRSDEAIRAFVADVKSDETGGECSLTRTGGSGATIASASYPTRRDSRMQVSITFDSSGRLVRFSERRGPTPFSAIPPGTPASQLDSLIKAADAKTRTTTISLDYAIDQAVASNRGGGKPTTAVLGTVRAIEKLETLGPPVAHLERARKLCGV